MINEQKQDGYQIAGDFWKVIKTNPETNFIQLETTSKPSVWIPENWTRELNKTSALRNKLDAMRKSRDYYRAERDELNTRISVEVGKAIEKGRSYADGLELMAVDDHLKMEEMERDISVWKTVAGALAFISFGFFGVLIFLLQK
jgi:hypothetical protein